MRNREEHGALWLARIPEHIEVERAVDDVGHWPAQAAQFGFGLMQAEPQGIWGQGGFNGNRRVHITHGERHVLCGVLVDAAARGDVHMFLGVQEERGALNQLGAPGV